MSRAAIVVAGALLCACHGGDIGARKTGIAWLDAPAQPVNVRLTFDSAHAESRVITPEGGTLTATGEDGSFFTLEIPKGALDARERITMIPVRRVDGLPIGGALAAVQLEPEGLRLERPATLTIETDKPVPVEQRVAFAYAVHGRDTHLYPMLGDSLEARLPLLHFSGYGFGQAPPNDPGRIHLLYASHHQERLEAKLGEAINGERKGILLGTDDGEHSKIAQTATAVMIEYYDGILRSTMRIAETDDRMAECAVTFYSTWLRELELFGIAPEGSDSELGKRKAEADASFLKIIANAEANLMKRAQEGCERHDLNAYELVLATYHQLELLGFTGKHETENLRSFLETARTKCLRFEIELVSRIENRTPSGASVFQVAADVPYVVDDVGEAPLRYVEFSASGRPKEDLFGKWTVRKDGDLGDAMGNLVELGMNYDMSAAGTRPGRIRVLSVSWKNNVHDTLGTDCRGRDETQKTKVAESFEVTLRIDPPTDIHHFEPVHPDPLKPFNSDMHEWMRFFTQFRAAAGSSIEAPAEDADRDATAGDVPQILTLELRPQESGVWRTELTTPDDENVPGFKLSETGHLVLRHTPT